ncbi:MAG: helix-turn-helix domain-containing protein [Halobacteriales archaeon]|nr:helix-turn-helix domain-containing protein [Halobacteriales archaeon]
MQTLTVDMVQYDCPYIDVSDGYDISFFAKQWDFNPADRELETRILATGSDRGALENGLHALADHDHMQSFRLLSRTGPRAVLRTRIGETDAMHAIREHGGYITGPFDIQNGSELWRLGFDTEAVASETLNALDQHNDYNVVRDETVELDDYYDLVSNAPAARSLLEGCRELSDVERRTLVAAVDGGYFARPKETDLGELADEFGISKTAVSKNLRRAEQKLLQRVVGAVDALEN